MAAAASSLLAAAAASLSEAPCDVSLWTVESFASSLSGLLFGGGVFVGVVGFSSLLSSFEWVSWIFIDCDDCEVSPESTAVLGGGLSSWWFVWLMWLLLVSMDYIITQWTISLINQVQAHGYCS